MLWTANQLSKHRFPRTYLFEPIIPRDGVVFFYGKRNIGKSHAVLGAALCVTHGGRWYGRYQTAPGPVVYVQADMGPELEQQRIHAAEKFYSMERLHLWFPNFLNLPSLQPDDPTVTAIKAINPVLIVWDTLRKAHRLANNDDDTPSWVYGSAKRLFPHCAHWFVHHDKKDVVDQDQLESDELFRGTGAWLDDCDTGIHVSQQSQGRLLLEFTKVRSAPAQPPIPLTLSPESLLFYTSSDQITRLLEQWKASHIGGTEEQLEQYLLSCFVGSPKVIRQLIGGIDGQRE